LFETLLFVLVLFGLVYHVLEINTNFWVEILSLSQRNHYLRIWSYVFPHENSWYVLPPSISELSQEYTTAAQQQPNSSRSSSIVQRLLSR
jgi:hypothetical protein